MEHCSEEVQISLVSALIKYEKDKKYMYKSNVRNEDKVNTLLTEENGRKNPFNTSEVKYFEV